MDPTQIRFGDDRDKTSPCYLHIPLRSEFRTMPNRNIFWISDKHIAVTQTSIGERNSQRRIVSVTPDFRTCQRYNIF
jgi:hypothetical protein